MRYDLKPGDVVLYQVVLQIETPFTNDTLAGVLNYKVTDADEQGTTLEFKGGLKSASVDKKDPTKRGWLTMWSVGYEALTETTATLRISKSGEILRIKGESHMPLALGHLSTLPFEHFPDDDTQSWTRNTGAWLLSHENAKTAGKEEISYKVLEAAAKPGGKKQDRNLVAIDRKYSLTIPEVDKESYQRTEGEGRITFNRELGVVELLYSEQSLVTETDNIRVTFPIKMTVYRMREEDIAKHQKMLADAEAKTELERTKYVRAIDPEGKKKSMATLRSADWREPHRLLRDMRHSARKELQPIDVDVAVQIGVLRAHQQPEVRAAADVIWHKWGAAVEKHGTDQQKAKVIEAAKAAQKLNQATAATQQSTAAKPDAVESTDMTESRTWTNRRGRPLAVGAFVRMDRQRVILKTTEGKEVKFPLALLSDEDKNAIERLIKALP